MRNGFGALGARPLAQKAAALEVCLLQSAHEETAEAQKKRRTQQLLGENQRRAARRVGAERSRRIKTLLRTRDSGHQRLRDEYRSRLRWPIEYLKQKRTDFAHVRIRRATVGGDVRTVLRLVAISVVRQRGRVMNVVNAMLMLMVAMRRARDDVEAVMVAVVGRKPVQTLPQYRDADVNRQQ